MIKFVYRVEKCIVKILFINDSDENVWNFHFNLKNTIVYRTNKLKFCFS